MIPLGRKKWLFFIPLLCLEPVFNVLKQFYYSIWGVLRNAISFLEGEPFVTVLIGVVLYLLISRR